MFDEQQIRLFGSLDEAHAAYQNARLFSGPSVYFHLRSLKAAREQDFERFAVSVYAALTSWGMHRMGRGGSKMRDFEEFRSSLRGIWPAAMLLQQRTPSSLSGCDWEKLKTIFRGIKCMRSRTSLVGNSKGHGTLTSEPYSSSGSVVHAYVPIQAQPNQKRRRFGMEHARRDSRGVFLPRYSVAGLPAEGSEIAR